VQKLTGEEYGDYYYPHLRVAQSHTSIHPPMKREDGIAYIALGLGKTVVEGERAALFSQAPHVHAQFQQWTTSCPMPAVFYA